MNTTLTTTANATETNPYAIADARWANVDNPNDEYANFEHLRPRDRRAINVIAADIDPVVARNVATYYAAKGEPWADAMATRLRRACKPANDNKRRAERNYGQPRNRRAA